MVRRQRADRDAPDPPLPRRRHQQLQLRQVGHDFKASSAWQATPNPSFHRVDEIITDGRDASC
jgi:hypothetical protein